MAEVWESIMTRSFACPYAIASFLGQAARPHRVEDSSVTAAISPDDVGAAPKILKRGKEAGPAQIRNAFYLDYSDAIAANLAALYTRWFDCSVFPASFG